MKPYFLRTETEDEMQSKLLDAGILIELEGEIIPTATVVTIGTIYETTGEMDEEGNPVMQALDGYHVNILADLTQAQEDLLPIIDKPKNPYGVFAS